MKKAVVVILALLVFNFAEGQVQKQKKDKESDFMVAEAGQRLVKFSSRYYIGLGLIVGGFAIATTVDNDGQGAGLAIGMVLGGTILQTISFIQIGKAGKLLIESTLVSNQSPNRLNPLLPQLTSYGLKIPLRKKKRGSSVYQASSY